MALDWLGSRLTPLSPRLFVSQAWHLATSIYTLALGDINLHFVWQACDLWHCWRVPFDAVVASAVCVAGVELGDIQCHLAWQVWELVTPHRRPFCVAGLALGDIHFHFVWQVWHLLTSISTLCGTGLALVAPLGPV